MSGTRLLLVAAMLIPIARGFATVVASRRLRHARVPTVALRSPRPRQGPCLGEVAAPSGGVTAAAAMLVRMAEGVGRGLRRAAGRVPSPPRDRVVGLAVLVAAGAGLAVGPSGAGIAVFAVWAVPIVRARARARRREAQVLDEVPEVVDLFRLAIGAGLNVRLAIHAVARHGRGLIVDEFERAERRIERGDRVADVLASLAVDGELGDAVRPLVDALVATERYGAPIGASLERAADDARLRRRRRHEELARKIPVRLLFPLVCCTLPALGLLTVVPTLVRSFPALGP